MARDFKFFNPITGGAQGITPNFPLGAGNVDLTEPSINESHFTELLTQLGINAARSGILKATLPLFTKANAASQLQLKKKPFFQFALDDLADRPLESIGTSLLGFPVFSNLLIEGGSWNNNDGTQDNTYPDIRIDACLFEITRDSNIVATDIQGRDNSVIEYISKKSWKVNCKGRIFCDGVNTRNTYPHTNVSNLIRALDANKAIKINSWFLGMAGINNIVVTNKNFPQQEGSMEWQLFEFDAIADRPLVLRIPK